MTASTLHHSAYGKRTLMQLPRAPRPLDIRLTGSLACFAACVAWAAFPAAAGTPAGGTGVYPFWQEARQPSQWLAEPATPPASGAQRVADDTLMDPTTRQLPPTDLPLGFSLLDEPLPIGPGPGQWATTPPADAPYADIEMFVGETRIFPAPDVARIAVGDGSIVHAAVADDKEVVVFARTPGTVSLVIWTRDGESRSLRIRVVHNEIRRLQHELSRFLERIPNARSAVVGDKIIIEGDDLSDADQERIADLAQRYPNIIDFTGRVGWDRMVLIDVQVVELPTSRMRELGIRWDPSTTGGINTGALWDAYRGQALTARPGESPITGVFPAAGLNAYLGINALLSARLHALSQQGEAVLLAQPQLMARSGSTASFLAGGELPYTTIDANGNSSTVFKPYGVTLDVTPRIDRTGTVRARIEVEVSAVDPVVNTPSGPALRTRRTATEFNVRSGQTIVISGFLSRETVHDTDSVPGLGSIPLLGTLFRSTRLQEKDTELAIFVTPTIVTSDNASLMQRAERSQQLLNATFTRPPQFMTPVQTDPFLME